MANQKDITLRQGDASPNDVVLYDLPIADVSAGTTIYLVAGDATAKDVILRDPTVQPGGYTPITITGTLAATETQDTASLSGLLVHVGTLAVTEAQDSASLTGKIAHTGTLSVTEAQDVAAFAGDVTTGGITITGTLEATETQDSAEFAGTVPSRTQSGGGGNSSVSRPKRLVITMDDKDYVITSDQLQSFLEYAKTQVKEKPVKKKKKKSKTPVLTEPPKITFKSIPPEIIPLVEKQIDRTNEILAEIWRKALIQYLQDIEDEEALMLLLS